MVKIPTQLQKLIQVYKLNKKRKYNNSGKFKIHKGEIVFVCRHGHYHKGKKEIWCGA